MSPASLELGTMRAIVAVLAHAVLTYVRYGQVIGRRVNAPIRTSGIVHRFEKRGREKQTRLMFSLLHRTGRALIRASLRSISLFYSPLLFAFQLFFSFRLLLCLPLPPSLFHRSPTSLRLSPHLSVILIPSFLPLSRRNCRIQATQN